MTKKAWYSPNRDRFFDSAIDNQCITIKHPLNLCIQQSQRCNFECDFCISGSSPRSKTSENWIRSFLIQYHKLFGDSRIIWSGGEPSIDPLTKSNIEKSSSLGNTNVMTSNAYKIYLDENLDWMDISLYGVDDAAYLRNTGRKVRNKCWANLEKYVDFYQGRVSVSILLNAITPIDAAQLVNQCSALGVSKIRFQRPISTQKFDAPSNEKTEALIAEIKSNLAEPSVAFFPNSRDMRQKRQGYLYAIAPNILTNDVEQYSISDLRASELVERISQDHFQIFVNQGW